jgi:hypothetical protein
MFQWIASTIHADSSVTGMRALMPVLSDSSSRAYLERAYRLGKEFP